MFTNKSFGATNFIWYFGDGTQSSTVNAENITHKYNATGEYQIILTAESITQCDKLLSDTINIFVSSNLDTQTYYDTICSPTLYKTSFYDENSELTYNWINAETDEIDDKNIPNPTLDLTKTKEYIIEITDTFGCSKNELFNLVYPEIIPRITFMPEPSCTQEYLGKIRFENNTNTRGTNSKPTYLWDIDNTTFTDQTPPIVTVNKTDSIKISLNISLGECTYDTSFATVFQHIKYPNIITPNGDGKNDTYKIEGIENGTWGLTITNRWGKEVFKSEDYQNDFGDDKLREGTYYYLITSPDESYCKGWLQIVK